MAEGARERLLKQFRELVVERLGRITKAVMGLEETVSPENGRNALRELHGLKGEARMMGFADINTLVHEMEELVRSTEKKGFMLSGGSTDALLVAADAVSVLAGATPGAGTPPEVKKLTDWLKARTHVELGELAQPGGSVAPSGPTGVTSEPVSDPPREPPSAPTRDAPSKPSSSPSQPPLGAAQGGPHGAATAAANGSPGTAVDRVVTAIKDAPTADGAEARTRAPVRTGDGRTEGVRIRLESLDALTTAVTNLSQVARRRELAAAKRLHLSRELALVARAAEDLGPQAAAIASRLNRAKELAAELHREAKLLANEELRDLSYISEEVQGLRMMPLAVLFEPYPRMVRDLSRELGKEVELSIEGESNQADRTVVEALRDPLMHLVRNAMDHAFETREARLAAGKSPKGHLTLRASREGERILIRVEDDGVGLDPVMLRKVAVRKGFLDEQTAAQLSDDAARDLIFSAGFSSKDVTTDLSGRGVGLDVVRVRMQGLGGDVALTSVVGQGTTFELRVPVSLTVAPLLFIESGDEQLCLTAAHVVHALKVEAEQIHELAGRPALKVNDEVLPFASIASILGAAPDRPPREGDLVLLIRGQGATAAISVDRVLEERVQPVLPLKGVLASFKHLTGATSLADGSLAMVLSAGHLIATARGNAGMRISHAPARSQETKRRRILVVDDSPLTRELISSLLEAVGYEILNASDGVEGFEKLARETVDMVVTDLEMPRMDGLELTRRVKTHATLRTLPVVIITTRGGEADRKRGMEAGADGYVAKGDLARQDLVDVVARLLG